MDEISAEEIPEPQSAESLEAAPEPGKIPLYTMQIKKKTFSKVAPASQRTLLESI